MWRANINSEVLLLLACFNSSRHGEALCHFDHPLHTSSGYLKTLHKDNDVQNHWMRDKNCKFCLCLVILCWLHVVKCIRWMTSCLAVYKYIFSHLYHSIRFPMASFNSLKCSSKKGFRQSRRRRCVRSSRIVPHFSAVSRERLNKAIFFEHISKALAIVPNLRIFQLAEINSK